MQEPSHRPKSLIWIGSSKRDLIQLPSDVQDVFGYALHIAQMGETPLNAKVLSGFGGAGVLEVIENHMGDTYRAVYTVRYAYAVYVLHCFQKKSKSGIATPKPDLDKINARLKWVTQHIQEQATDGN